MEEKGYLIIYGYSVRSPRGCYREQEIKVDDIKKFSNLIAEIEKNADKEFNWNSCIMLERQRDGSYKEHHLLYDMYPMIETSLIDEFSKLLPTHISKIESIKIFKGEKIKII